MLRASCISFDVKSREDVAEAYRILNIEANPISILVNNAGLARDAPMPALTFEDWEIVTRTTLDGFYNVTQPLLMPMARKRWGSHNQYIISLRCHRKSRPS